MLPTSPRLTSRSTSSSCATPAPISATRVSCGVTLMRISSLMRAEQLRGLVEGQPHDAGVAAAQLDHEAPGAALDRIGAGLVVAFAAGGIVPDLVGRQPLESYRGARQRALH